MILEKLYCHHSKTLLVDRYRVLIIEYYPPALKNVPFPYGTKHVLLSMYASDGRMRVHTSLFHSWVRLSHSFCTHLITLLRLFFQKARVVFKVRSFSKLFLYLSRINWVQTQTFSSVSPIPLTLELSTCKNWQLDLHAFLFHDHSVLIWLQPSHKCRLLPVLPACNVLWCDDPSTLHPLHTLKLVRWSYHSSRAKSCFVLS